jgi:hypothetical protein
MVKVNQQNTYNDCSCVNSRWFIGCELSAVAVTVKPLRQFELIVIQLFLDSGNSYAVYLCKCTAHVTGQRAQLGGPHEHASNTITFYSSKFAIYIYDAHTGVFI